MGGGPMKKQVVKRMGGGAMKKQVVKKRGGGSMKPMAMNRGGGLISEHKRMAMGLPLVGSPTRRRVSSMSPGERKSKTGNTLKKMRKQTPNDRLDERLGMKDGKESTKSQSMKSRRDESRAMKRGGSMSPGEKKARSGAGPTFIARRKGLAPLMGAATGKGLTSSTLMKAFKKAKEIKPSGRLNLDDIKRAMK
tara:strand:- start:44 stop:622 length:579 start_codon:yes stop_codon:yes gene_type:complete